MPRLNWDGNDFRNNQDSSGTVADNISRNGKLQQGYKHGSLTKGLVAYYPMEKGQGEILHDAAFDNIGQIKGASWSENTVFGSHSLQFNGSSDYVETDLIWDKDNLTLAAWVYPRDAGEDVPHDIYDDIDNNSTDWVRLSYRNNSAEIQFDEEGAGGQKVVLEAGEVINDQWQHLAAVRDVKKGKAVIYVDGEEVGRTDLSSTNTIAGLNNAHIGKSSVNDQEYVDGRVKDLRVYDRRLSQPEIEALANLSKVSGVEKTEKNVPGLNQEGVLRYGFEDDTGDSWGENIASNNTTVSPSYKTGVYGQSKNFDGNDDYLGVPVGTFSSNNNWTCSLWFKNDEISKHIHFTGVSDQHPDGWTPLSHFGVRNSKLAWWDDNGWRQGSTDLDGNKWYHASIVGGDGNVKMYLNGSIDAIERQNIGNNIGFIENIGRRQHNNDRFFNGVIDDFRLYNKTLTPLQIEKLYHKSAYRINRRNTLQ